MNFNNIKKICLKELKESLYGNEIKMMIINLITPLIFFIIYSKSIGTTGGIVNHFEEFFAVIFLIIMITTLIKYKFTDEIFLGRFQSLIPLPMSLKEIFLGKYLSIIILSFFYIIMLIIILKLISLFFYGTLSLDLILTITSLLLFIIIQIYFVISVLLSLKYKSKYIVTIFKFAPFIIFGILIMCVFIYTEKTGLLTNESFKSLNQSMPSPNVSTNILSALPDHVYWLILSGFGLIVGIIILILLSIMIYLLNKLDKEKIIV
jgi:hypothetical protein